MKMIVWDCDETLWHGTIYHDEDVKLKPETKEVLKQIDKLDVIQYVCSTNDLSKVKKKINDFGLSKYFKGVEASLTHEKDVLVKRILKKEKIAPEETLFIDDTGIKREIVRLNTWCNVDYDEDLYNIMKYFDTNRLVLMNQQRNRVGAERRWVGSKKDFMKHVQNEITIKEAEESELPRITNLANRTNELNAIRSRYTDEQMLDLFKSEDYKIWVAYLKDKFGDYGLIGEIIVNISNPQEWFIRDWCVSCRTMGRGVGTELLRSVKEIAGVSDVKRVVGCVIPNDDNYRMGPMYIKAGFRKLENKEESEKYYYEHLIE